MFQLCRYLHVGKNCLKNLNQAHLRKYFYFIDDHGQVSYDNNNPNNKFELFLDNVRLKNFTSCFKGLIFFKKIIL